MIEIPEMNEWSDEESTIFGLSFPHNNLSSCVVSNEEKREVAVKFESSENITD
jgi:hypothetical protein